MDIYLPPEAEGVVDIGKARAELAKLGGYTSSDARKAASAEITAAVLLDIAASLRPIGAEAADAMRASAVASMEGYSIIEPSPRDDFLVVGDLVVVDGNDEPGEVRGFGNDQDEITVDVLFANGAEGRYYLAHVHRLVGDERDDDTMQEAAEASVEAIHAEAEETHFDPTIAAELNAAADAEGEPEDDFDAPTNALDTLKAKSKKKGKRA